MIDFEAMLISIYPDSDGMRKLIDLGLKDENVGILGDDAVAAWRTAKTWFQRKNTAIPMEIMLHDHEQYIRRNQEEQVDDAIDTDPTWLVRTLQTRYLHSAFKKRLNDANDDGTFDHDLEYGESLDRVATLVHDLLAITNNSSPDKPLEPMSVDLEEFVEDTLTWEERVKTGDTKEPVTFGFQLIDNVYKGIRPGELAVMAAYTKLGKSFLLCKQALAAAIAGNKVALWTLENSEEETYSRLTALAGGFSYEHISNKTLPPGQERERFRELVGQDVFDRLFVKQPVRRCTLDEMYWESYNVNVDLFIGDQLSHVYFPSLRRSDPDWLNEGEKLLAARRLSRETNVPSIWAAQLNQKAANKDDLDSTMMGRSQGIVQGADFVFYLSDPSRGLGNVRKLSCSTSRRGPRVAWELIFDFAPMKIEAVRVI